MPLDGYCPHCFAALDWAAQYCPHCHTDLAAWSRQSYPARLIHALQHPLADVRLRAVIALGLLRWEAAAPALVACTLRDPTNVPQALEVVHSLQQLLPAEAGRVGLAQLAATHPAHAAREAARGIDVSDQ